MIIKALKFAIQKHEGQFRRSTGLPYIIHPLIVSELLREYKELKNTETLVIVALLHDTIEDTDTNFEEIKENFNEEIAKLVLEMTSNKKEIKKYNEKYKDKGKNEYLKNKIKGMSEKAFTIKLIDRLSNIMDTPTEKYKIDTLELLKFLKENRNITKIQNKIIKRIIKELK